MKYVEIFEKVAKENKVNFEYFFKSNTGRYSVSENKAYISKPINAERLQVGLHEIGHKLFSKVRPMYLQEYLAEMFSFKILKAYKIPIKRKIRVRSKRYIAIRTQMAVNRGLKRIDKRVKEYIKKDYPETAQLNWGFI